MSASDLDFVEALWEGVEDAADLGEMEGGRHFGGPCYLAGCWVGAERDARVVMCNLR